MEYQWKLPGLYKLDPDIAGKELERIYQERKTLKPEVIVAEAEAEDAPLHSVFEWNDRKAAGAYRCMQAKQMMRLLVKTVSEPEAPVRRVTRAFVRTEQGFSPIREAMRRESSMDYLLKQAKRDLLNFIIRYRDINALKKITAEAQAMLDDLEGMTR